MKIEFREVKHGLDETHMGHKIFFHPCYETDTISATANTWGYTPLTAIARYFDWDSNIIHRASESCNTRNEVAIVTEIKPTLILVPKTREKEKIRFLINDLLDAASEIGSKILHFTHFGFTQTEYPEQELQMILNEFGHYTPGSTDDFTFVAPERGFSTERARARYETRIENIKRELSESRRETTVKKIVWDYDFRRWSSLNKAWRRLKNRQDAVGYIGSSNLIFTQTKYLSWPD
ncbi:hypothetical protein N9D99_08795 [Gammaproteobacteria bacterium]|nr:hypothetical protein [Gammaproteobacteria bacterium]